MTKLMSYYKVKDEPKVAKIDEELTIHAKTNSEDGIELPITLNIFTKSSQNIKTIQLQEVCK